MVRKIEAHLKLPTPITPISISWAVSKSVQISVKRDDLIHPHLCGNKWRKLKYNLIEAEKCNRSSLVSFGGAFSNNLIAVAAAGHLAGVKTFGFVRSYQSNVANETIKVLREYNMELKFAHPNLYNDVNWRSRQIQKLENCFVIPEGGTNQLALDGVGEMMLEIEGSNFTHVVLGIGTGGTLAGVVNYSKDSEIIAVSPFRNHTTNFPGLSLIQNDLVNYRIVNSKLNTKFGSFHPDIESYCNSFYEKHRILLDPIYTGKAMMTLQDMIVKDEFPSGSNILFLHTGGLQGISGFNQRYGCHIYDN